MMKRQKHRLTRKLHFIAVLTLFVFGSLGAWYIFDRESMRYFFTKTRTNIVLVTEGFTTTSTRELSIKASTVNDALATLNISLGEHDRVTPALTEPLAPNTTITIERAQHIIVAVDDEEKEIHTLENTIARALADAGIVLGTSDIILPSVDEIVRTGLRAEITRVHTTQEVVTKDIPFEKVTKKDDTKDVSYKKIEQEGIVGKKEITYALTLHDGEEEGRTVADEKIITKATDEITIVGTREAPKVVKTGKSHTGQASWYAHKGCDCAANPWLPFGSYVKVTNRANGKSVVVRINDRGPFVPGRIIDLDKKAFSKIASIGAGVIDVKMEEVKE